MKPIALITGATSGIGLATAKKLADDFSLIICGRRKKELSELADIVRKKTSVHTLVFDVRDRLSILSYIEKLPEDFQNISLLINNAGNAHGLDTIDQVKILDLEMMIDANVKGLLYVSEAVIPLMMKQKKGHIINISSIAGKETYSKGTIYCASKAAVESISKGMRLDLLPHGIKVTNIAPGAVDTNFSKVRFKGDQIKAHQVYEGYEPLKAEDIANSIHFVATQPDHVQIADMTIFPKAQANATTFLKDFS
ncbi:sulfoacetaldehyde reductase [Flavobacteriaceae bacterium UJ101]|nr:sulfoacetaldehyde reductase [Flavobacteriaceae bacterium UJ101]